MLPLFGYDPSLIADLASRFDLRDPNREALTKVVKELATQEEPEQLTLDLATGVGKTYILAALLEYAAAKGVKNLLVVLPGKTVRTKTIANFTPGAPGFIEGAEIPKVVITPDNFADHGQDLSDPNAVKLFLLNIHNLVGVDEDGYVAPDSAKARELRTARPQEALGSSLLDYLTGADDLLMVLDESHSYSASAKTWAPALERLRPAARVGLTATPVKGDEVIYRYTLRQAIDDRLVKSPVLAMRAGGYPDNAERGQLRDAKEILDRKAREYRDFEDLHPDAAPINPIMLVACTDTGHADEVAEFLRTQVFRDEDAVLTIHSKVLTDAVEADLAAVQEPGSKVRAVVQVDMLNEGWNVHNVAVLVPLRALASTTLTEQLIGRGLRLPYGKHTGNGWVDALDIIWHTSVRGVLMQKGIDTGRVVEDASASTPTSTPESDREQQCSPDDNDVSTGKTSGIGWGSVAPAPVDFIPADVTVALPTAGPMTGDLMVDAASGLHARVRQTDEVVNRPADAAPEPKKYEVVLRAGSEFDFPKAIFRQQPGQLVLSTLDDDWVKATAAKVAGPMTATLLRERIVYRTDDGQVKLVSAGTEELSDFPIQFDDVVENIVRIILKEPMLKNGPARASNEAQAVPLARRVLKLVPGEWTLRRAEDAASKVRAEIRKRIVEAAKAAPVAPEITALRLPMRRPSYYLPAGEPVPSRHDVPDLEPFVVGRHYEGWERSLYDAASFDAYETEFRIATLLDSSSRIEAWTRLYIEDDASIEYGVGRRYFPDFVAIETDGTHWIIEGKSDAGRDDDTVQEKRDAALTVLREMEGLPGWKDTCWGYVICYQDDVKRSQKWEDLIAFSHGRKMWD